jgi:hypothetical protein
MTLAAIKGSTRIFPQNTRRSFVGRFRSGTVSDEKLSGANDLVLSARCCTEDRGLLTLDLDFATVQARPPKSTLESCSFGLSPEASQRLLLF